MPIEQAARRPSTTFCKMNLVPTVLPETQSDLSENNHLSEVLYVYTLSSMLS